MLGAPVLIKSVGRRDQLFFAEHPMPPDYAVPLHVYADEDELFYLLEGELQLDRVDGSATPEGRHITRGYKDFHLHTHSGPAHAPAYTSVMLIEIIGLSQRFKRFRAPENSVLIPPLPLRRGWQRFDDMVYKFLTPYMVGRSVAGCCVKLGR